MTRQSTLFILAGPNGAGKSSAAPHFLASRVPLDRYVNPDDIASSLDPQNPYAARQRAGRHAIQRIRLFERAGLDFALESTLSGAWTTILVRRLMSNRYLVDLSFLWLPDANAAVERVRFRVERQRGHYVPEEDVRRRFARGLVNLEVLRTMVTRWRVIDGRDVSDMPLVAEGERDTIVTRDPLLWAEVLTSIRTARVLG